MGFGNWDGIVDCSLNRLCFFGLIYMDKWRDTWACREDFGWGSCMEEKRSCCMVSDMLLRHGGERVCTCLECTREHWRRN